MQPEDRKAIEHFVRVTLGCKCPDEVFRSITLEEAGDDAMGKRWIELILGNRLLVHVLEVSDPDVPAETFAAIARSALKDRDARGLDRYRLVVATSEPARTSRAMQKQSPAAPRHDPDSTTWLAFAAAARQAFSSVAGADERAHVHLVDVVELPDELRQRPAAGSDSRNSR